MKINVKVGSSEETVTISEEQTIEDLLKLMEISTETVVVKKNDYIVIDEEILKDGDSIEIIQVIYGG